ncbi:MAG: AAA family ATPase, partial [Parabacteroides distasonis]|nr:AAA family ATPase [Parabacteroides distasonis]
MILRHLDINGYHCYKETGFDFAKEVTVLIGKNGTGKSSLLKAICDSLSFIFNSSEKSWGFSSLANGISELGVANIQLREIYHNERMEVADNV